MTAGKIAQTILRAVRDLPQGEARRLIAIAGPPAAGKSTVSEQLCEDLNGAGLPSVLVPMDGFHLDNDTLRARGLLARKGAPETFDLAGFQSCLSRLVREEQVDVPLFDRDQDCTVPNARRVEPHHRHVIVEGNYLLLDRPGWRDLAQAWAFSVFVTEPFEVLRTRLVQRWLDQGLSEEQAVARATSNDLPNAELILTDRLPCDLDVSG